MIVDERAGCRCCGNGNFMRVENVMSKCCANLICVKDLVRRFLIPNSFHDQTTTFPLGNSRGREKTFDLFAISNSSRRFLWC